MMPNLDFNSDFSYYTFHFFLKLNFYEKIQVIGKMIDMVIKPKARYAMRFGYTRSKDKESFSSRLT
jgi:hypothetical protein